MATTEANSSVNLLRNIAWQPSPSLQQCSSKELSRTRSSERRIICPQVDFSALRQYELPQTLRQPFCSKAEIKNKQTKTNPENVHEKMGRNCSVIRRIMKKKGKRGY